MNRELAGVVAAMTMAGGAMAQDAVQWRVQDGGNGHWYARIPTPGGVSWSTAAPAATAKGAHLVSITSDAENALLVSLGAQAYDLLGANTPQGQGCYATTWTWHSGEPWSYTNWAQYEPSLHCDETVLVFAANQFPKWNNFYGGSGGYWVEWDADCNNDGIVDYGQILDGSLTDGNVNNIPDCCEGGEACVPRFAQWRISDGGNGHWYMLNWEVREWPAAQTRAVQLGGHLATITTNAERLFVLPLCDNHIGADVWLGASRANAASPVQWVTGEPWSYAAWGPGSPNPNSPNDYLEMIGRSNEADFGLWNLELIYAWGPGQISLIEFDADCNSDGIVDFGQIRDGTLADANHDNIPDCCEAGQSCAPCPGDIVEDHTVNGVDLAAVINAWGTNGGKIPRADTNHDGIVDGVDLANVLGSWGPCP